MSKIPSASRAKAVYTALKELTWYVCDAAAGVCVVYTGLKELAWCVRDVAAPFCLDINTAEWMLPAPLP